MATSTPVGSLTKRLVEAQWAIVSFQDHLSKLEQRLSTRKNDLRLYRQAYELVASTSEDRWTLRRYVLRYLDQMIERTVAAIAGLETSVEHVRGILANQPANIGESAIAAESADALV